MKSVKLQHAYHCKLYIDDNIVELDELFEVYLTMSPGLVRRVSVDRTRYTVTIEDDDSKL